MEHNPPVPTLYPGRDPLHKFLGFTPGRQIVSMSARDPDDGREMPPNGKTSLSVSTLRGVRKVRNWCCCQSLQFELKFYSYLLQSGAPTRSHVNQTLLLHSLIRHSQTRRIRRRDLLKASSVQLHGWLHSFVLYQLQTTCLRLLSI